MALAHVTSGQSVALTRAGEDTTQFSAIALAKTAQLELIRLVLPAGKEMPKHHVKGEITFQCLSGRVAFITGATTTTLNGGEMLYLDGGVPHAVRALADSVALVTIILRH
ncbi:UNVERIFIED_ORG: quercetin dioxygenase-like cupin family protein [Zoogloea ramigera]|uniref:Cupin domain-containing protein n=1 Tax=Duganella zoogloeoides TaxID=75659 RepID=A0ABZ0XTR9_9BURK|nr:cupin domain-containing protein [Duganella zoogloeoides]WQH03132.1 cupin domain-containing protein [Duganella zoogloeoides]